MEEKRKYRRWEIGKAAQCCFQKKALSCSLEDISLKGVRVVLQAVEAGLGESCELTITIADELEPMNIGCDIAWQKKVDKDTELGLCFTRIKDRDKERIFNYVFEHFPQQVVKQWWSGDKLEAV